MMTDQLEALKKQLEKSIENDSIYFKPLKQDGGSYCIQYQGRDRVARIKYVSRPGKYKCVCDNSNSKRIFEELSVIYKDCAGFELYEMKKKKAKVLYLDRYEDMKSFLLLVVWEYIRAVE